MTMQTMSSIRRDFIASHLRSQLSTLRNILNNLEERNDFDCGYANESLKNIEASLRQIRQLCVNNI